MNPPNRTTLGLLCLALGALATTRISAQVLNPGFETAGATSAEALNWTVTQAAGGPVYAVRTNRNPRSGSFHYEVRLASSGAGPVVAFAQSGVPVTGGSTYPFTFYANALTGSEGFNAQWRIVWNAGGDTGFRSFTPGNNSYALISNSVTAPAAATSATVSFYCAGAAIPSQSATIQLDDVSLTSTNGGGGGVETNLPFQITLVPGVRVSWFASNNVPYQVQWASGSGSNTPWTNLGGPWVGQGSSNSVFDASGTPEKVYQVLSFR